MSSGGNDTNAMFQVQMVTQAEKKQRILLRRRNFRLFHQIVERVENIDETAHLVNNLSEIYLV
jgi:hypothetical protein